MSLQAYMTSYGMPVIVTRGNNVYGPHQFPEKMIPKFTLLAKQGKSLPIHGDGMSVRYSSRERFVTKEAEVGQFLLTIALIKKSSVLPSAWNCMLQRAC